METGEIGKHGKVVLLLVELGLRGGTVTVTIHPQIMVVPLVRGIVTRRTRALQAVHVHVSPNDN